MLSVVLVALLAVFLVERIEDVVESGVPDQFLGLILLPLVEKAAEHLTAIDEAWDGQIVRTLSRRGASTYRPRTLRSSTALAHRSRLHSLMHPWWSLSAGSWARTWT